jgi:hypothetical protein
LARSSKFPVERIQYVPDATVEAVRSIDRGILFVIAFWTGPAFRAYHELTAAITRLKAEEKLQIVVADIDGVPELMSIPEIGLLRGSGETAWIRSGKILAYSGGRETPSGLLARRQIVQIIVRHGTPSRPKGALVAMRTFVFLNRGRLLALVSESVESVPLIHRVIDLRDRPELRITGQFFRSDDDNVGVHVGGVKRFLTCANNAVLSHF